VQTNIVIVDFSAGLMDGAASSDHLAGRRGVGFGIFDHSPAPGDPPEFN
jgi:hypothetical protein